MFDGGSATCATLRMRANSWPASAHLPASTNARASSTDAWTACGLFGGNASCQTLHSSAAAANFRDKLSVSTKSENATDSTSRPKSSTSPRPRLRHWLMVSRPSFSAASKQPSSRSLSLSSLRAAATCGCCSPSSATSSLKQHISNRSSVSLCPLSASSALKLPRTDLNMSPPVTLRVAWRSESASSARPASISPRQRRNCAQCVTVTSWLPAVVPLRGKQPLGTCTCSARS
mmetsp:Transcript_69666/g.193899  ORF Transcript_69666/g.193899 Transcript_69666/m.193899 type:complete len:232 (+) Transcript_69666:1349-2044(+)